MKILNINKLLICSLYQTICRLQKNHPIIVYSKTRERSYVKLMKNFNDYEKQTTTLRLQVYNQTIHILQKNHPNFNKACHVHIEIFSHYLYLFITKMLIRQYVLTSTSLNEFHKYFLPNHKKTNFAFLFLRLAKEHTLLSFHLLS